MISSNFFQSWNGMNINVQINGCGRTKFTTVEEEMLSILDAETVLLMIRLKWWSTAIISVNYNNNENICIQWCKPKCPEKGMLAYTYQKAGVAWNQMESLTPPWSSRGRGKISLARRRSSSDIVWSLMMQLWRYDKMLWHPYTVVDYSNRRTAWKRFLVILVVLPFSKVQFTTCGLYRTD